MSLTGLGWFLVVFSVAATSLIAVLLRSQFRRSESDIETCKALLEDIGNRQRRGELTGAEADAERLALLAPRRRSQRPSQTLLGRNRALIAPAVAFLLVAGIGAATSRYEQPAELAQADDMIAHNPSGDALARLTDYARDLGRDDIAPTQEANKTLPDVGTMIDRLAARLKSNPQDIAGWQLLGWSYYHTDRFEESATAFAQAVQLDSTSTELKQAYEAAKAKASGVAKSPEVASLPTGAPAGHDTVPSGQRAAPLDAQGAQIRSMVDGLADRLEKAPRDVDGWSRLMRSRVVLGEREVASSALRKALQVFKDDQAASDRITAAGAELGLNLE